MFSTCLFCHAALGVNESIAHFPVGRRLAFDGERGRLWALCPRCAQWNLAPIEERWEALEECERAYRDATRRVSTDNIALAQLRDGTELVRVGRPLLPEFAAWRYGRQFIRRSRGLFWRTQGVQAALGGGAMGAAAALGLMSASTPTIFYLAGALGSQTLGMFAAFALVHRSHTAPNALLVEHEGALHGIGARDAGRAVVRYDPDSGVQLDLRLHAVRPGLALTGLTGHAVRRVRDRDPLDQHLEGAPAAELLARLLPVVNRAGATKLLVSEAVGRIERQQTPRVGTDRVMDLLAPRFMGDKRALFGDGEPLGRVSHVNRLAAEMALHEEDERCAMAGELGALYARWEEAERIAAIVDRQLTVLRDLSRASTPAASTVGPSY